MPDAVDDILGGGGGRDEIDDILDGAAPAAPSAHAVSGIPGLSSRDAGPAARRAAALRPPGPRDLTAEEAGVMGGPLVSREGEFGGRLVGVGVKPFPVPMAPEDMRALPASTWDMRQPERDSLLMTLPPDQSRALSQGEAGDVVKFLLASTAGAGAGRVVGGAAGKVLPKVAAPVLAPVAAGAAEGATIAKAMGGDPLSGAALGALVPSMVGAAGVAERAVARGAPARVGARIERNLGENVKQTTANKVTAVAKKGALGEVVNRNPELRKALAIEAAEKPAEALKAVQKTKERATAARDADFDTMQEHFADKPPSSQATISGILDDYDRLLDLSPADLDRHAVLSKARAEVMQLGDRLRKAQKLPPAEGDYSGTVVSPKDLRDLERTIGRRAYEMGTPTSVKRQVNVELYKPLARQMNQLAENTPGVNAKAFANTGQDIHVLVPVEEALQFKADKLAQGKKPFMERLTNAGHAVATPLAAIGGAAASHGAGGAIVGLVAPTVARAAGRAAKAAGRRLDFRLAEDVRRFGLPSVEIPSAAPRVSASINYARSVSDAMKNGASLKEAVAAADATEHH